MTEPRVFPLRNGDTIKTRQHFSINKKKSEIPDLLIEVHDFKAFSTQDGNPSLQEDEIIRLRWQEKVAIDPEPLRLSGSESKTRSQSNRSLHPFIDLIPDRFQYAENAVQLEEKLERYSDTQNETKLTFFFFIYTIKVLPWSVPTLKK